MFRNPSARSRVDRRRRCVDATVGTAIAVFITVLAFRLGISELLAGAADIRESWKAAEVALVALTVILVALVVHHRRTNRVVESLKRAALSDPLTGVGNRDLLLERLTHALSKRRDENQVAVFYIDLDGYKQVNDTFGHAMGDALLVEVAQRLRATMRDHDTVARVGGDEFVVVVEDLQPTAVAGLAQRLLEAFFAPFTAMEIGAVCAVQPSIGVAIAASDDIDTAALLARADQAMYEAKRQGGARCAFHD